MIFFRRDPFLFFGEAMHMWPQAFPCITSGIFFIRAKCFRLTGEAVFLFGRASKAMKNSSRFRCIRFFDSCSFALNHWMFISTTQWPGLVIFHAPLLTACKQVRNLLSRILWEWVCMQERKENSILKCALLTIQTATCFRIMMV